MRTPAKRTTSVSKPVAVVDTNVFISALLGGPSSSAIYAAFRDSQFTLATSEPLLEELTDVLTRPRLGALIAAGKAKRLITLIRLEATLVPPPKKRVTACRDPKDNMVLECALAARADCVVTRDEDLLTLSPFRRIALLEPSAFLKTLKS